jgi:hypothetical protein
MPNANADRSARAAGPAFEKANKPKAPANLVLPKPVKIPSPPAPRDDR